MKIELKSVKHHKDMSEETECFSATIFVEGKRAGVVSNRGHGGSHSYHWLDRTVGDKVVAWAEEQPLEFKFEKLDQIVSKLLERHLVRADYTSWCKKATLFRLVGDKAGEWRSFKREGPYDKERTRIHLLGATKAHKQKLECILNEDIEAAVNAAVP